MNLRRLAPVALFAALLPLHAVAGDRYVPIEKRLTPEELASVGLAPEQVARLNTLLRAADARDAATTSARLPAASPGDAASASPMQYIGLDDQVMTAKVRGSVSGWAPGTVFELGNGQQWQVLKGNVTLPREVDSPTVRLIPGIAGRWFLELDEDHPKARVYRID